MSRGYERSTHWCLPWVPSGSPTFIAPFKVEPGRRVRLPKDFDPSGSREVAVSEAKQILRQGVELLAEYQARLAAQDTYGVVVVLQAMDAAGKDGTIRHVMSGVNPQGVQVSSFKVPSSEDLDHDYLWRYAKKLPERGNIGIFNRSYYEEVLVVRVHPRSWPTRRCRRSSKGRGIWERRFREINDWEHYLTDQGYRFVKLFLNVSKEEQRRRSCPGSTSRRRTGSSRPTMPRSGAFWDDYQKAFCDVLSKTSTAWAPWYVIPADDKPFARVAAAGILANALIEIDPRFPRCRPSAQAQLQQAKEALEEQAPPGVARDPMAEELKEKADRRRSGKGKHKKGDKS